MKKYDAVNKVWNVVSQEEIDKEIEEDLMFKKLTEQGIACHKNINGVFLDNDEDEINIQE